MVLAAIFVDIGVYTNAALPPEDFTVLESEHLPDYGNVALKVKLLFFTIRLVMAGIVVRPQLFQNFCNFLVI